MKLATLFSLLALASACRFRGANSSETQERVCLDLGELPPDGLGVPGQPTHQICPPSGQHEKSPVFNKYGCQLPPDFGGSAAANTRIGYDPANRPYKKEFNGKVWEWVYFYDDPAGWGYVATTELVRLSDGGCAARYGAAGGNPAPQPAPQPPVVAPPATGRSFPFSHQPKRPYPNGYFCMPNEGDCAFGSLRDSGARKHAGVDLYAPPGTPVYAIDDGTVRFVGDFYLGTWEIQVTHSDLIARYGEVKPNVAPGITAGATVRKGQLLGYVGILDGLNDRAMTHFELFSEPSRSGPLTIDSAAALPYKRRNDLMNPTSKVMEWMNHPAQPIR